MQAGMGTATRIEKSPLSFWRGWLVTVLAGTVASAFVGNLVHNVLHALLADPPSSVAWIVLQPFEGLLITVPVALCLGFIPLTLSYCLLRVLAPRIKLTIVNRVAIGVLLGVAWNIIMLSLTKNTARDADRAEKDAKLNEIIREHAGLPIIYMASPINPEWVYFPFAEIQAAALAVALISRRRWFG